MQNTADMRNRKGWNAEKDAVINPAFYPPNIIAVSAIPQFTKYLQINMETCTKYIHEGIHQYSRYIKAYMGICNAEGPGLCTWADWLAVFWSVRPMLEMMLKSIKSSIVMSRCVRFVYVFPLFWLVGCWYQLLIDSPHREHILALV